MEKLVAQGHVPSGRRRGRSPTCWVDTTKQLLDMSIKSATELTEKLVALLNILEEHSAAYGLGVNYNRTKARVAMTKLTKIWRDHNITKATKMSLVQSLVFSIFLYASETWTVKKADRARIDAVEMWT
ncbi:unnamed protein product [Callosobruchus maculatus]|uniref:Reverse transcriptase domain-containing protein n=1 Tax=Callosobruchus maculatus TaxID=64391 RepID=A0A653DV59_CALMS|nr:unnamed protein product [Callosobruchus maculatus]